ALAFPRELLFNARSCVRSICVFIGLVVSETTGLEKTARTLSLNTGEAAALEPVPPLAPVFPLAPELEPEPAPGAVIVFIRASRAACGNEGLETVGTGLPE